MSVRDVVMAAAGIGGAEPLFVESVFSTYLYTGNGSTQTITNGIDLAGEGGMVWLKPRSESYTHKVYDTARGTNSRLYTNSTDAAQTGYLTSFNSDGFSKNYDLGENTLDQTYASWTFRKAPKFFDVVTYTGNGTAGHTISHNLGSVPGCIIVKNTNNANAWAMYHRSLGEDYYLVLNTTAASNFSANIWSSTAPTESQFTVGLSGSVNDNGASYVAYLFAHNDGDGDFGENADQDIIKCGSYTGTGSAGLAVTLGFEPQWLLIKNTGGGHSAIYDVMRQKYLAADLVNAENQFWSYPSPPIMPSATGITIDDTNVTVNGSGNTYIYIAIRRGPMKTPESGTEVYNAIARTGTGAAATVTGVGFAPDLVAAKSRNSVDFHGWFDRLRGAANSLSTSRTDAENQVISSGALSSINMDGMSITATSGGNNINSSGTTYINHFFRRAPGFFDVVAYTGTGVAHTEAHNLGVAPEFIIAKNRDVSSNWAIYHKDLPLVVTTGPILNSDRDGNLNPYDFGLGAGGYQSPTNTVFTVGPNNSSGGDGFISYLFATVAGVSKVGSYTGTAADLNVDCGFSAGARFILIKRTDSTGDWYVWDSARGITAGNDPYLLLNSTAAEVTGTDYIDPLSSGFTVTSSAPAALNASGGNYIFLAIA